ncbi:hypothetical protein NL676_034309 [Syzygium grande]|nr:hypothetical protein NL676_034309 [Syzygium grande]
MQSLSSLLNPPQVSSLHDLQGGGGNGGGGGGGHHHHHQIPAGGAAAAAAAHHFDAASSPGDDFLDHMFSGMPPWADHLGGPAADDPRQRRRRRRRPSPWPRAGTCPSTCRRTSASTAWTRPRSWPRS